MDMLNDMFQRQARRLESQLYQRAQDQRTIEATQRQAQLARAQVRQLEQHHLEQAARISQGAKSLQHLQDLIRESLLTNRNAISVCESLEKDVSTLRQLLEREAPAELANIPVSHDDAKACESLRARAHELERVLAETERAALVQIGPTPTQSVAMSGDCNPLNDLSAVADYASKASVGSTQGRDNAVVPHSPQLHQPASAHVSWQQTQVPTYGTPSQLYANAHSSFAPYASSYPMHGAAPPGYICSMPHNSHSIPSMQSMHHPSGAGGADASQFAVSHARGP